MSVLKFTKRSRIAVKTGELHPRGGERIEIEERERACAAMKPVSRMLCYGGNGCASLLLVVAAFFVAVNIREAAGYNIASSWTNGRSFTALYEDGTVQPWGDFVHGGSTDGNGIINDEGYTALPSGLTNVTATYSTEKAIAALMQNGKVRVWGAIAYGGGSSNGMSGGYFGLPTSVRDDGNVRRIYSNAGAFFA